MRLTFCQVLFSLFVILLSHNLIIIKGDYNPDPADVQTSYKIVSAALSLPAAILALKHGLSSR